ncbi:MAG: hotdog fold thioesterase [Armatimonadota bacterium]|nr:hotdog fold thioesterase [Armatimonadota bacterium]
MPRSQLPPAVRRWVARDAFARRLGIEIVALGAGRSRLRLRVAPWMTNVHGITHGGVVFALADAAFAAAANSHGVPAVALAMSVQFLAPSHAGDVLVADAREARLGRRAAFYAMTVKTTTGTTIATCQGVVHRRAGEGCP